MGAVRWIIPVLWITCPTYLLGVGISSDFSLGYQGERGVLALGLVTAGVNLRLDNSPSIGTALNWGFGQHPGLNGATLCGSFSLKPLNFVLGYQYQYWSDWQIGENRGYGLLLFSPTNQLTLGLGICWRRMFYRSSTAPRLPFYPEWNLIYLLRYNLLNKTRFRLWAELSNYERLQIKNPQQFPLGVNGSYRLYPRWQIFASCRTALNGLSTSLVSFTAIKVELGVKYGN